MKFFDVFVPVLVAMWFVIGLMCIRPGLSKKPEPWGSEREAGDYTRFGVVMAAIYYLAMGPFEFIDLMKQK